MSVTMDNNKWRAEKLDLVSTTLSSFSGPSLKSEKRDHHPSQEIWERKSDVCYSLSYRLLSFNKYSITETGSPLTFAALAAKGYYLISAQVIACSDCAFQIDYETIKNNPADLYEKHKAHQPKCPNSCSDRAYTGRTKHVDGDITTAGAIASFARDYTSQQNLLRAASTAATGISTAKLCPTKSDSRLPVPVNVKSHQERMAADSVLQVRTSNSDPTPPIPESTTPEMLRNEATSRRCIVTIDPNKPLSPVRKPICRNSEYDTYEGRLGTFYDWPSSNPMRPEELARAGFYYVHNNDKVKCPYCFGDIYDWEPNDNAFSEHMRHNPKCEFLKWVAYTTLTSPLIVPRINQSTTNGSLENHPAVKGVQMLGYDLDTILEVIKENKIDPLKSETILEAILVLENKLGRQLLRDETEVDREVKESQGAIGGLDLNVKNKSQHADNKSTESSAQTSPVIVPRINQSITNGYLEHHSAVKGVQMLGYDLDTILKVIKESNIKPPTTDTILDAIFALQDKFRRQLVLVENEEQIQGAVGELNENVENNTQNKNSKSSEISPVCDELDDDIYEPSEPNHGVEDDVNDNGDDKKTAEEPRSTMFCIPVKIKPSQWFKGVKVMLSTALKKSE